MSISNSNTTRGLSVEATRTAFGIVISTLIVACSQSTAPANGEGADTVFLNGRVYTVDAGRPWVEAVAITDGRISFVGASDDAKDLIGTNTTVVDLDNRMMMPAFQDSHIHPIRAGMQALSIDLSELNDIASYRSAISEYTAANPELDWIVGGGWSLSVFGPGGMASKSIIDEIESDRPVFLYSADGHSGWVNSRALEIAGISRSTPNPADGVIDRDTNTGEIVGSLQEGAMNLVAQHIPPPTTEDQVAGMSYARDLLHSYGITSLIVASARRSSLETLNALEERRDLDLRVVASLWWDREKGLEQIEELNQLRDEFSNGGLVRPTAIKIMQDGSLENYTAALLDPYLLPGDPKGYPMVEPTLLNQALEALDAAGFQVHFHTIGDAATRQALDAIEEALIENGQLDNRHHISHLEMIHPDDLPRFRELAVVANFQPLWAYADEYITELTIPFIGEERAEWLYTIGSVQDAGGMIAFGSDWFVSTANPFPQIEVAITRMNPDGGDIVPFLPEERIDLESAIAAFTINAAFLAKQEDDTGSIEAGKLADLIVLDQNLFEIPPAAISDTRVLLTMFEGRPVYGELSGL